MSDVEGLKKEIDTSGNEALETQEMEEFLKSEENIKKLGEAMEGKDSPELVQEIENVLKDLCDKILSQTEISENQQKILNYFVDKFGDKYPELKEKITNKLILTTIDDITTLQQEIDEEINKMIQNIPLKNLQELGIDISQQDKKSKGIRWIKVMEDIKKVDDLNKITEDNLNEYISIPNNIPIENYPAIAENLKQILYRHLQLHPGRKAIIGNEGYSTGMSLEDTRKNDKYETNLHNQIQKLQKKSLNSQVDTIVKDLPNNSDLLDLWLKTTLNSKKYSQETILTKFFNKIPVQQANKFFQTCEKNPFINELKNNYALYWINKNNCIKTGDKYCFLDRTNQSNFKIFKNKGIELSKNLKFDELYAHTEKFYNSIKPFGFDATIPIEKLIEFDKYRNEINKKNKELENKYREQVRENNNPYIDALGQGYSNAANYSNLYSAKNENFVKLEEEFVKILLLRKPKPTGRFLGISGLGVYLDFSKGNDPKKIVRDSFSEQLGDQREKFKYDLKNDRQAAFGSAMGMIGGIVGSSVTAVFTGNIFATSAGFTAGLRLGNGIGQEIWNSGEFLYEQISGNTIDDGNNGVQSFGQGFLRGVGALDQNYEYVGTAKFLSGLGFDYLSTVATFGLSQKFGGFLGKLEGVKFAGGALKFGMEELILENFFVDIPMNIVQTGFETFTGIDDGVTIGNTAIGNQHTVEGQGRYKSGSLSDMLRAMKDATTQNLSFENLSQTFFNTVLYGGFLEGGGAAIKKMKGYLPAGQVSDFTEKSAIAATAFAGLTNFMNSKEITFNKDGNLIKSSTKEKIEETDPIYEELFKHLNAINATKAGVIESFEVITETQKQMIADPENRTGLLFRLGLISPTNTPLNILKKKKELVEKKLNEAKAKGDNNKITQLEKLLDIYTDAETKLINKEINEEVNEEINEKTNDEINNKNNEEINDKELNDFINKIKESYIQEVGDELQLTDKQINNIKTLKNELGLEITTNNINSIKDIKLTPEQIDNIKTLKDFIGEELEANLIEDIKDIKLTPEQIDNIKTLKNEFGIESSYLTVEDIKDIKLTPEQIDNIKTLKNELGIDVLYNNIEDIKDIKLTPEQINNIKTLKNELGIDTNARDINLIKDTKLTPEQIDNIKTLKDFIGEELEANLVEDIKDIKLTPEQIDNIKTLKNELGIDVLYNNIEDIKDIKLTPEQIDNIKALKNELGIEFKAGDITIILENYDIFKIDNNDYYEGYNYTENDIKAHNLCKRGKIIEEIQQYIQNVISENRDIRESEILNQIHTKLITLPKADRLYFLRIVSDITKQFNTVRKYIDFENGPYKSPKELLCAIVGITDPKKISKITDNIKVKQYGIGLTFYVGKSPFNISYSKIVGGGLLGHLSDGVSINTFCEIPELTGTNVVRGSLFNNETTLHEGQHRRNLYFMPDHGLKSLNLAKDEITAYLRGGIGINIIKSILRMPKRVGGMYQYELRGEARENHKTKVKELLSYAGDLIKLSKNPKLGLTKEEIISMLSDTPADGRKNLHSTMMEAVEIQEKPSPEKIKNLKQNFITRIKSRVENQQLIRNLTNRWNTIFSNYKIDLDAPEFRRSGTAKIETAINEIESCNSLEEVKHILNDPKYSHIGRGYDNKGGIEISTIIDEVISGKTDIESIPEEIRNKIEGFIKGNMNTDYFDGKSHQFEVTESQARSNSEYMDNLINEENQEEKLQELKNNIEQQYKQATGENLELSEEQLLSILDAHEQDGILGELTLGQLKQKVKVLNETITDPKIRRFLLEAGFCGSWLFSFKKDSQNYIHQNHIERQITKTNMNPQETLRFNRYLPSVLKKGGLTPNNKIDIGNGTFLYTTNKIVGKNSGRQYIIGYSFDSYGTMHLRQFYRSMSEGCWRACPGMREDGNLSKGEFITDSSYETTTKVDINLGNTFDNLSNNYYNDFKNYGINNKYFEYSPISYIANEYHKDNILQEDMGPQNIYIRKLFPNLVGNDNTGHNRYGAIDYYNGKYGNTVENVIKGYNKLVPEGLDYKHMKINPSKSYSYHHDYLGNVNVQVCTTKRNGIDLDFHFARAINSPDKVWIENVVCSDAQLNSRGVYNKQINAGPLVAKPIDYDSQCPNGPEKNQVLPIITGNYRDIRNLYQGNPIIKKFKQIS